MLLQYAEELGLSAQKNEHRVLTAQDMVTGIGRKATTAELEEYLLKGQNDTPIDFEIAFAKYLD